jgi:hypothetical protein
VVLKAAMHGRLLVAYSNSANYVATTAEYIEAFGRHSSFDVHYLHVTHGSIPDVDLRDYDAVVQSYCVRLPLEGYVAEQWLEKLAAFTGVKVLAVQDEYDDTHRLLDAIGRIHFDVVLTCVPEGQIEKIYPAFRFPHTAFIPVLTGYVPESVIKVRDVRPLAERPIVVGYRGRDIGPRYGRLAWDKLYIGMRMRDLLRADYPADKIDIAWGETDRLYGSAWYEWIARCRVNLVTESGSNAFDWDGAIVREYQRRNLIEGGKPDWQAFLGWLEPYERPYDMGQISPRVFEAAALRTALVAFRGQYSGILKPDEHYVPLERDFSNMMHVLGRICDVAGLQAMADRTYDKLIASGEFSYKRFVEQIDWMITESAATKQRPLREPLPAPLGAPMTDCPALRDFTERPTREPQSPLIFTFKHTVAANEQLRIALEYQSRLAQAFADRVREENLAHAEEVATLRTRAMRARSDEPVAIHS